MTELEKAARQALEALERHAELGLLAGATITAIREALADSALDRMAENARELGLDYEPIVEKVEDSVGMGHKAWDMVDPKELANGFHEALAEPPCKTGSQCTSKCQQCEQPAEGRDWSLLEATQESLREHMAEIKRLRELLEQQPAELRRLHEVNAALMEALDRMQKHYGDYSDWVPGDYEMADELMSIVDLNYAREVIAKATGEMK